MLKTVLILLRGLNILNWVFAALFAVLLVAMIAAPAAFDTRLAAAFPDARSAGAVRIWLGAVMAMTLPVAIAAHLIFTRLAAIIRSVAGNDAFSLLNAGRLRLIAFALLAIDVIDLGYGALSVWASARSSEYFGWTPSIVAWFAVLLLLVLARVFREGAAMRADLEGTV